MTDIYVIIETYGEWHDWGYEETERLRGDNVYYTDRDAAQAEADRLNLREYENYVEAIERKNAENRTRRDKEQIEYDVLVEAGLRTERKPYTWDDPVPMSYEDWLSKTHKDYSTTYSVEILSSAS